MGSIINETTCNNCARAVLVLYKDGWKCIYCKVGNKLVLVGYATPGNTILHTCNRWKGKQ